MAERARTWLLCVGFFVFVPLGLMAKQSMATSFIAMAVLVILAVGLRAPRMLLPNKAIAAVFVLLAIYVAVTHLFIIDCQACAAKAGGKLVMLALVLWVASSSIGVVGPEARRAVGRALTAGLFLAIALVVFELSTDSGFFRLITGRQDDPDLPLFRYNRGTTALSLLAWPAAAWLWSIEKRPWAVAMVAMTVGAAAYGDSASALVAGMLAAIAVVAAAITPAATLTAGLLITGAFTALAPWLLMNLLGWVKPSIDSIPPSVLDRIEIWNHGAKAVLEAPILGHGIGAMRHLPVLDPAISGYRHMVKPPTHPHDAALQIWLELGGIGVILFAGLVWITARSLSSLTSPWRGAAIAASAAVLFTAMVSYGLWQETWLGIIAMTVLAFRVLAPPTSDTMNPRAH